MNKMLEEIKIDRITERINFLTMDYNLRYKCNPKYVKVPLSVKKLLFDRQKECFKNIYFPDNMQIKFMNLSVCETASIENIDQIEVF